MTSTVSPEEEGATKLASTSVSSVVCFRSTEDETAIEEYQTAAREALGAHVAVRFERALVCRPQISEIARLDTFLGDAPRDARPKVGVVTSAQAIKALLESASRTLMRRLMDLETWFVVGAATGKALRAAGANGTIYGDEDDSGSATKLIDIMDKSGVPGPFIYVCSNKRRPTLPNGVAGLGIAMHEFAVYQTLPAPVSPEGLIASLPKEGVIVWAFFSPSGLESPGLIDLLARIGSARRCAYAAIGPTTADAMRKLGLKVEAMAELPSSTSLMDAIKKSTIC